MFSPELGLFFNEVKKIGTDGGAKWLDGWKEYFAKQNLLAIIIDLALTPFLPANAVVFGMTGKTLGQLIVDGFSGNFGSAKNMEEFEKNGASMSYGTLSGAQDKMAADQSEWDGLAGKPSEIFQKKNEISDGISRTFESNGRSIMQGLWDGMKAIWRFFAPWWANIIADIAAMEKRISGSGVNASGFGGGGISFETSSTVAPDSIPALAQGTVVPRNKPFAAMLGDNKTETEVVSPLSTMKQALIEAMQEGGFGGDIYLTAVLDGAVVHKSVVKRNSQATIRTGRNPLLGV
ncbi:hypothetical protein SDC9_139428 [bioreactor metagenome]|uniref:Uncharacterized protein n=1 Tax=bioreactor metagenome TaxID=1076179 RepID=A0A645DUM6_9ZZZZ